jgi:hypothetical protein
MSLRSVHLLFIALAALLAVFVAGWAIDRYQTEPAGTYILAAAGALAAAAGLAAYALRFRRATRGW